MSHSLSLYEHDVTVVDGHKVYVLVQLSNWKILKELFETKLRLSSRHDPKILQTQLYDHPLVKDENGNNTLVKIPSKVWKNYIAINDEIEREVRTQQERGEQQKKNACLRQQLLMPFENAWCPLFGDLPAFSMQAEDDRFEYLLHCYDRIRKARAVWGIKWTLAARVPFPAFPVYSKKTGHVTNWPSPREVKNFSKMTLLYARQVYRSYASISLRAIADGYGVSRLSQAPESRILYWTKFYAGPKISFLGNCDANRLEKKCGLILYLIIGILLYWLSWKP